MMWRLGLTSILALSLMATAAAQTESAPVNDAGQGAEWQICNETSFILRIATAVETGNNIAPKGWRRLRSSDCVTETVPKNVKRYIYAESSPAHQGGIREWSGGVNLCAGDNDFTTRPNMECALQNLSVRPYMEVKAEDLTTTLVEPDNFGSRAITAGLQRLLKDAGYAIKTIDGVSGRRTARTLSKFLKDKSLASNISAQNQIDALESAAITHTKTVGLRICNQSSFPVWLAVGHRHRETWKSRGWWPIGTNACDQLLTDSLMGLDVHVFARQEPPTSEENSSDKILRSVATSPAQFCLSDARFSALGRDDCKDNGYEAVTFRPVTTNKAGVTMSLSDSDFVDEGSAGLRR